ncbi:MAG: UbiA-like polyprenyltransferase [Planctomycetota bacterium]
MWCRMRQMLEMVRFSHTVFALPFALSAAIMAWRVPTATGDVIAFRWRDLFGILVCMVCARSAAMAYNRLVDRNIDARNPRTRQRHLPAGALSVTSVMVFAVTMSIGLVAGTLLFLPNVIPLLFSVPLLAFLFGYSHAKRLTSLAHFWLGGALMLAPIAAWIAIRGHVLMDRWLDILPAIILGAAVLLWVAGFDMIYACLDADFDVSARLHSVPARLGVWGALRIAAACHLGMIVALFALPWSGWWGGPALPLGWIYGAGISLAALLLLYEHWLVRPDDLSRVNMAFFNVNAVISFGLFVVITLDLCV